MSLERPLVERQRRARVGLGLVVQQPAGRDKAVRASIADVRFRRPDLAGSRRFAAVRARLCHCPGWRMPSFGEQLSDDPLGYRIFALAVMSVTDAALRIDEVMRGPIFVLQRVPQDVFVVE